MADLTLAEFLSARIAERESVARDMRHQAQMGRPLLQVLAGGTGIRELVDPERILAECEAQRRILERATSDEIDEDDMCAVAAFDEAEHIVCILAELYADHPDYDQEWRP